MNHRNFIPATFIAPLLGLGLMLGACSSDPNLVPCPGISAPPEGVAAFMEMDASEQLVDVRFNGINATCELLDDASIKMVVSVGLKLTRSGEYSPADVLQINLGSAIIDADDAVVSSDVTIFKAGFKDGERQKYPVLDYEVTVKADQRLVLSLMPRL
jgi:hypothetical protein